MPKSRLAAYAKRAKNNPPHSAWQLSAKPQTQSAAAYSWEEETITTMATAHGTGKASSGKHFECNDLLERNCTNQSPTTTMSAKKSASGIHQHLGPWVLPAACFAGLHGGKYGFSLYVDDCLENMGSDMPSLISMRGNEHVTFCC